MGRHTLNLGKSITRAIKQTVAGADTVTLYRDPLVRFVDAQHPRFQELRRVADPDHMMPQDLLPSAQSVVSFFIPFHRDVVEANARDRKAIAEEWVLAYVETNDLIGRVTDHVIELLASRGIEAAAEPATGNFDPDSLTSRWSHKSVAVVAGLGSFGRHQMIITDAGCAGRLGSLVTAARLTATSLEPRERCLNFYDGSCLVCMEHCPMGALSEKQGIDRQRCWDRCLEVSKVYEHLGTAQVCGKCAIGPCSFEAPV